MIRPNLEFVYEAAARLGEPVPIGATPDGTRRMIPIFAGGRVEGPRIRGVLVGDAADWQLTRPDGVTVADALYALRTDDDVVIQIRNRGLRHGPPDVMQRLTAGDDVNHPTITFARSPSSRRPPALTTGSIAASFSASARATRRRSGCGCGACARPGRHPVVQHRLAGRYSRQARARTRHMGRPCEHLARAGMGQNRRGFRIAADHVRLRRCCLLQYPCLERLD